MMMQGQPAVNEAPCQDKGNNEVATAAMAGLIGGALWEVCLDEWIMNRHYFAIIG